MLDKQKNNNWFWIALTALLISLPFIIESFYTYLLTTVGIYVVIVLGVNMLTGNTGQITMGQAGFYGLGAYTAALTALHFGVPLIPGIILGGLVGAGIGFLVGVLALRIVGAFLAIATLGFGFAVQSILMNVPLFMGRTGISISKPTIFGIQLQEIGYYYFVLAVVILFILLTVSILRSGVGRAFMAIKSSETAAQAMGVNLRLYKTMAFTLSAFYAGVAGGLMAYHTQYISAETFNFWLSTYFLVAAIVGGLGSVKGSVLGAGYIVLVPYFLADYQDFSFIFLGLVLILVVVLAPEGMAGLLKKLRVRATLLLGQNKKMTDSNVALQSKIGMSND